MTNESQVQYGPFLQSFGNCHKQINHAKRAYKLTGDEAHLLQCFIQALNRPGYKTHLQQIIYYDIQYWEEHSGLLKQHIYRAFRTMSVKGVMLNHGRKGQQQSHSLHHEFVQRILDESVEAHKPVGKSVEKSNDSNQSGFTTQTNLVSDSNQSGFTTQTNLVSDSNQSGFSPSYIEDPSSIPKDSLSITSRNPPVDNVDDFSEQETRLAGHYHDCDKLASSRLFIAKLKAPQLKRLDMFLDFLDHVPDWTMSIQGMNLAWAKWDLKQMERPNPALKASEAQEPNMSA